MSFPTVLEKRLQRPVAIFGAGVSGTAVKRFLSEQGVPAIIYDKSGADGATVKFCDADAALHDLCVYSPGFPQTHPWLLAARRAGMLCLTEIDFAATFWQGALGPAKRMCNENTNTFLHRVDTRMNLIAVTGTNGKTTLTEFISFAHRKAGRSSAAVGNNGIPMTTLLFSDAPATAYTVCEVSSFQAEDLHYFSPQSILWTNFDEDHVDRHGSLENYFRAKFRLIAQQQALRLILGNLPDRSEDVDTILAKRVCVVGESVAAAAKKFGIALPDYAQVATRDEVQGSVPAGTIFETYPQMENYAVAKKYWLANGFPIKELEDAAKAFSPRAHRLAQTAVVGEHPKVCFWNDSKGTNFHSVYAALETFRGMPVYWIGGGRGKGGDIPAFVSRISKSVKSAFLIGETSEEMQAEFLRHNVAVSSFGSLKEAVCAAFSAAKKDSADSVVVLFSPGFASFDMFKSYADRGVQFEQIVNNFCED